MKKIIIPKLSWGKRLLLYLLTIFFAALSIGCAVFNWFPIAVASVFYGCAALTLTASCYYIVIHMKSHVQNGILPRIEANAVTGRIKRDYYYRTVLSLLAGAALNIIFAAFNGVVGIISLSPWFGTLAAYYLLLSIMRVGILSQHKKNLQYGEDSRVIDAELRLCKKCGILLLFMTVVLIGAVVLLLTFDGGKEYPGFTIYAVAAYAFYKITMAIINVVKTYRMKKIMLMIIRDIGFVDACVAILSLQTAMFAAFGGEDKLLIQRMNGMTGLAVCVVILVTAIRELRLVAKREKSQRKQEVKDI